MYTSQQVRAAIEGFERQGGESWPFVKSLIVDLYTGLDKYRQVLQILAKESKDIREMLEAVGRGAVAAESPLTTSEAPIATNDGDAQQQAAEAAMNAAAGPHPMSNQAKRPNGKRRAPSSGGPVAPRMGADGTPLTPEEAAIEAQMDAAIEGM